MATTFPKSSQRVPTTIRTITVTLMEKPALPNDPAAQIANYTVQVLDQNGQEMVVAGNVGDLVPYLTQTDVDWLLDFMARLRAKAQAEFIG